ncbi:AAA family ATPase [uncultured Campylobacter sp.]|uniref:ATP-dependent DNA helicase n=1 Tax=uncultured Campylobacter sp. TaxID=218934 RepID=UPI0015AB2311|nr:AAA family ATPase [uncultured Campylobacter sp.]
MINFIIQKLKDRNIFITGGAGVGKSYVIKKLIENYRARGKLVIVLGSTGISAVEIGGVTVHSFFRFGICKNHEELKGFDRKQSGKLSELRKILALADLIVIDEISMIGAELFEMIYLRISNSKFNGRLLVTGDFYQLPPVRKEGESVSRASLFSDSDYAFGSYAWRQCEFFYVEMIGSKRTADAALYRLLCELRLGTPSEQTAELMRSLLIDAARAEPNATIISGRNAEVDAINNARLAKLNTPPSSFEGVYEALQSGVSEQKIQKWIASLNTPQSLTLKEDAKVLFTANKSGEFFNGEQGVVEKIEKSSGGEIESVVVKKPSGMLSRVGLQTYELSEIAASGADAEQIVLAQYYQFPLKLAYAITIHKSQGMSIPQLICDIDRIFAKGQLYVALSRATSLTGLGVIYTRAEPLLRYLQRNASADEAVVKFYQENEFYKISDQKVE